MKDELITFETAKLAKEKGFSLDWSMEYFLPNGEINLYSKNYASRSWGEDNKIRIKILKETKDNYPRPTQSLLQRFYREKYKLHINVDCNHSGWFWDIFKTNGTHLKSSEYTGDCEDSGMFTTYELCLEDGLKNAPKLNKL